MAYQGYPFVVVPETLKRAVWNKGTPIPNYDASIWRRDICRHAMNYGEHGNEGEYGWEIDHIYPRARGGQTTLNNLQPLYWMNNRRKGDACPWSC
jgi:5-methylcytosine-specific restriction endonuclease McrA